MKLVRDQINGRATEDIEKELIAWRQCHADQWVVVGRITVRRFFSPTGVKPDHCADARDKHNDTHARPDDRRACRHVANKRL